MSEPAESYLREVLQSTADGILVVDEDGKVVTSNRRFAELWQIPDELLQTRDDDKLLAFVLEQLVHPHLFLEKVKELYGSREEGLDVLHFKDGRVFERFSAPLVREKRIVGRVWSFRDITARTQAEAALREGEARFRSLYNFTPVMLHSIDVEGNIVDVNDFWLQRMGYRREEVLGRPTTDFMTTPSREYAEQTSLPRLKAEGQLRDVPYEFVTASGETFDALLSAIAQYDSDGRFTRSFTVVVDVSERKRAERERQRLEDRVRQAHKLESLGLLAGGIAHDFNNLLVGVLGNADLALRRIPEGTAGREFLPEIITASKHAAELCHELLAYSGGGRFVAKPVDVSEVVRELAHLLEASVSERVRFDYEFAASLPTIEADVTQLRQVVMNLITNAAEAVGDEEGTVTIGTGKQHCRASFLSKTVLGEGLPPGEYVYFEVRDSGRGMSADTQAKIFDPFFTSKTTGRGLGLAATLGIVRGHGGTIEVQSEEGHGSLLRVFFPASDRPADAREVSPGATGGSSVGDGGLVLVVDDEPPSAASRG